MLSKVCDTDLSHQLSRLTEDFADGKLSIFLNFKAARLITNTLVLIHQCSRTLRGKRRIWGMMMQVLNKIMKQSRLKKKLKSCISKMKTRPREKVLHSKKISTLNVKYALFAQFTFIHNRGISPVTALVNDQRLLLQWWQFLTLHLLMKGISFFINTSPLNLTQYFKTAA